MRTRLSIPPVLIAFALMTASCAGSARTSAVAPPRLTLPQTVVTPCALPRLPDSPTQADLESNSAARGAAIVTCDAARRLALDTLIAERRLLDAWRAGSAEP